MTKKWSDATRPQIRVYIVASPTGTLYIGMATSIDLAASSSTRTEASKAWPASKAATAWSSGKVSTTSATAVDRETQLKGWRREKKIALIEALNPSWKDLAKDWGQPIQFLKPTDPTKPADENHSEAREKTDHHPQKKIVFLSKHEGPLPSRKC